MTNYQKYFDYCRETDQSFSDDQLIDYIFGGSNYWSSRGAQKAFIKNNPPVSADSNYVYMMSSDGDDAEALLIRKDNPKLSKKISNNGN